MTQDQLARAAIAYYGGLATLEQVAEYLHVSPRNAWEAMAIWVAMERFKTTIRNVKARTK